MQQSPVDACVGVTTFVAIPADTRCWLQAPRTAEQVYRYKGAVRTKQAVVSPDTAPCTVAALAARLPASRWYRRRVSEGTKGPIVYAFARQRVTLCRDGLPDRPVWLVIKRTMGPEPTYSYYSSNAPASTPLRTFVLLSGLRWAVEQCFEEGKTELGMDHYEVRKYAGWHHHMLTTMLAHFFLWHLKLRHRQRRRIVEIVLPLRTYNLEEILALIAWVQRRNHRAYLSHSKRRETES